MISERALGASHTNTSVTPVLEQTLKSIGTPSRRWTMSIISNNARRSSFYSNLSRRLLVCHSNRNTTSDQGDERIGVELA